LAATPAAQDDNEWRKRLTAVLLRADSHILIDNINQPLNSASLAAALTQPMWSDRLLGQTCSLNLLINQIWIATGNNLVTSDEIARRCVRIRLDANVERPDQRRHFKHESLMRWVQQHRLPLMTAAVTIISAWVEEGMPRFIEHRKGSYEVWGEVLGGILQTNAVDGFLQNEHEMYDTATTETTRLVEFIEGWYQCYGEQAVQVKDLFQLASRPDGLVPQSANPCAIRAPEPTFKI
jgi:putative DNA primase/helicase